MSKLLNQIKEEKSSGYNKVEKIVNSIDDLASFSVGTIKENILEECQSYCLENLDKPERRELVMGACKNMADKSYTVSEELFNASVDMIANYIFIMRKALDQPIGAQA
ncbi:hypothetical protein H8D85_02500 [bacterium]|nr:hypothetical protein [bacterium]